MLKRMTPRSPARRAFAALVLIGVVIAVVVALRSGGLSVDPSSAVSAAQPPPSPGASAGQGGGQGQGQGQVVSEQRRAQVAARTEELHRRWEARRMPPKEEADDRPPASITPERAVEIALQSVGGGELRSVELGIRQGTRVYVVRLDKGQVWVDAETGTVIR